MINVERICLVVYIVCGLWYINFLLNMVGEDDILNKCCSFCVWLCFYYVRKVSENWFIGCVVDVYECCKFGDIMWYC